MNKVWHYLLSLMHKAEEFFQHLVVAVACSTLVMNKQLTHSGEPQVNQLKLSGKLSGKRLLTTIIKLLEKT